MKRYDVKGLPCPQPVITTKDALEQNEKAFEIVTDSAIAKDNITKFLISSHSEYSLIQEGEEFVFTIKPNSDAADAEVDCSIDSAQKTLLFTSDTIGSDRQLGAKLAKGFLSALPSAQSLPKSIFFINEGVKLSAGDDEEIIATLQELEKAGVEIVSCGLCLQHYGLDQNLRAGSAGNALQTLETLIASDNTVTLG